MESLAVTSWVWSKVQNALTVDLQKSVAGAGAAAEAQLLWWWPLCSQSCLTGSQDQQVGPAVSYCLFAPHFLFAGES